MKPPRIIFVANLWTLDGHPSPRREWPLARKVRAVAEAGFDAVNAPPSPELTRLVRAHGLRYLGFFAAKDRRQIRPAVAAQRAAGAELVNVQLGTGATPLREAKNFVRDLARESARVNLHAALELHRGTITERPEFLDALDAEHQRRAGGLLPITWDASHAAVVRHLRPAAFRAFLFRRRDLIQAARIFHLRPFNGQHAQVPVMDARGRLTPEFRVWREFAAEALELWLAGPRPGGALWVCPEIGPTGPHGYNLSTMPPSWAQALVCLRELRKLWRALTAGVTGGRRPAATTRPARARARPAPVPRRG